LVQKLLLANIVIIHAVGEEFQLLSDCGSLQLLRKSCGLWGLQVESSWKLNVGLYPRCVD